MTIDLAKVEFDNDFFSTILPDGSILTLNKIDESLAVGSGVLDIKAINIEIQKENEEVVYPPSVIGLGDDILIIKTDYEEYEGKVLTAENMAFCTIEVYE